MMHTSKQRWRLATRLQEAWQGRGSRPGGDDYLWRHATDTWAEVNRLRRQLGLAEESGFELCMDRLLAELHWQLGQIGRAFPQLRESVRSVDRVPSLADWVRELEGLAGEFGSYETDPDRAVLHVVTDPITLEGVALGPYRIELVLDRLGREKGAGAFRIVALDAKPATGREDVTHPHISSDELCAGDATVSIGRALADGRLADAFVLVRSVLTAYNPRSAYVRLEVWDGLTCDDCGDRADRDESSSCPACGNDLCDRCTSACRVCEETSCNGCLTTCDGCDDPCCSRCLERVQSGSALCPRCRDTCRECKTTVLHSDLDDDALCESCREPIPTSPQPLLESPHAA
jgi:hypothetical protein